MQYLANVEEIDTGLSIAIGPPKLNLEPSEHRHTERVCKIGSRSRRLLMVGAELTKILHLSEPEEAMATNPTEFPRLNAELATEATDVSLNWFRPIAEQNLKQSCGSLQELLNVTRRMIGEFDNQASAFCEHSISLAEETIANTFECGVKLLRVREPQELAQIQTDFLSRQAQAIANHTKEFNECFVKGAEQLANTAAGSARKVA